MRRFISLLVWLMVCMTCTALEPKEICANELSMKIDTKTEQFHQYFGSRNFIAEMDYDECSVLKISHRISVSNGIVSVVSETGDKQDYKIASCSLSSGNVFKDRGTQDVYTLNCSNAEDNSVSTIYIINAKDGAKNKTFVYILNFDEQGAPVSMSTLE